MLSRKERKNIPPHAEQKPRHLLPIHPFRIAKHAEKRGASLLYVHPGQLVLPNRYHSKRAGALAVAARGLAESSALVSAPW